MKILFKILLLFSALSTFSILNASEDEEEYVQVYYSIKPDTLKSDVEAKIFFNFIPKKGIRINLDPPIEVQIDNKIATLRKLELPKSKTDEYLDHNKPVTQTIKLKKNLKPGKVTLKGNLTYFYCSEKEGWCSKAQQTIEINITIKK